jgi:hypothetical protein
LFGAIFKVDVGGRWTVDGSYAPRQRDANGNESCGAPVPIACSGKVTNPSASERSQGRILFNRRGKTFLGQFSDFVEIREDVSGQPSACNPDAGDDTLAFGPLFGFAGGSAQAPFVAGLFKVPVSRLSGRRAFSISPTPDPSQAGECSYLYVSCSQTNRLAMKLTFTPAR